MATLHDARCTVGWIAPMALELTAAIGILDEYTKRVVPRDDTRYYVGRIRSYYVVVAICPRIGIYPATTVLANMRRSFRNIKYVLCDGLSPVWGLGNPRPWVRRYPGKAIPNFAHRNV